MKPVQQQSVVLFVYPFDDQQVKAGQGTITLEIPEELPDLRNIIIPVGGGLIAGMTAALRERVPHIRIIGVDMRRSLHVCLLRCWKTD